jgi:Na+-transporting NADH:ubiquinone oxidoreductase subunit NqrC
MSINPENITLDERSTVTIPVSFLYSLVVTIVICTATVVVTGMQVSAQVGDNSKEIIRAKKELETKHAIVELEIKRIDSRSETNKEKLIILENELMHIRKCLEKISEDIEDIKK